MGLIAACTILKQVVEGLLYLHSHKIIHRDMTLANLLLTKDMNIVSGLDGAGEVKEVS
jgi:serine/threonine protein kinase